MGRRVPDSVGMRVDSEIEIIKCRNMLRSFLIIVTCLSALSVMGQTKLTSEQENQVLAFSPEKVLVDGRNRIGGGDDEYRRSLLLEDRPDKVHPREGRREWDRLAGGEASCTGSSRRKKSYAGSDEIRYRDRRGV